MKSCIIENTDMYTVESFGNGLSYSFYRKKDNASGFVQGEDASAWRKEYEDMLELHSDLRSCFYEKPWNYCLSFIIDDYLTAD